MAGVGWWCMVWVGGALLLGGWSGGLHAPGGVAGPGGCMVRPVGSPACTEADPPSGREGHLFGQYAYYWNASLLFCI